MIKIPTFVNMMRPDRQNPLNSGVSAMRKTAKTSIVFLGERALMAQGFPPGETGSLTIADKSRPELPQASGEILIMASVIWRPPARRVGAADALRRFLKDGTLPDRLLIAALACGIRPIRDGRFFTENAPKPRSSTRSPRAITAMIPLRMASTIFSTSR